MGMEVALEIVQKRQVRQSRQMVVIDLDGKAHHLPITTDLPKLCHSCGTISPKLSASY